MTDLVRHAHAAGQLQERTDVEALGQVLFSLVPGYLLQRRIIGDVDPVRYADAMDAMLRIS